MLIHSLTVSSFRRFHQPLKIILDPRLTVLDGPPKSGKKSLLQALAIAARHSPFTSRDFCLKQGKLQNPCHLALEWTEFEQHLPGKELPGVDWRQDYLLNQQGLLETVSHFSHEQSIQERRCLRAQHPDHPELHDLLQLNNAQLRRRLTLSTVPTREVDRRSNRAIRHALRRQHATNLQMKPSLLPLHSGDALHLQRAIDKALPHCVLRRVTSMARDPAYVFKEAEREFQRRAGEDEFPAEKRRLLLLALPNHEGVAKLLHKGGFCRELKKWVDSAEYQIVLVAPHSPLSDHFEPRHLCRLSRGNEGSPIIASA